MFEIQEAPTPKEDLLKHLRLMREAHIENPMPDLEKRKDRLRSLLEGIQESEEVFTQSISEDFGLCSTYETANFDITTTIGDLKNQIRNTARRMRPRKRSVPLYLLTGRARLLPQPLGVVGVISP